MRHCFGSGAMCILSKQKKLKKKLKNRPSIHINPYLWAPQTYHVWITIQ